MALIHSVDIAGFTHNYWRVINPNPNYISRRAELVFVVYKDKAYKEANPLQPAPGLIRVVRVTDPAIFDALFEPVKAGTAKLFDQCYIAALADFQFAGAVSDL